MTQHSAKQRTSIYIDPQLWRRFKALLALQGKDMSPVIEAWIERYVARQEKATASRGAL
jgi:hypothetical protein